VAECGLGPQGGEGWAGPQDAKADLQHGSRAVQQRASSRAEVLGRSSGLVRRPKGDGRGGAGLRGKGQGDGPRLYLGGGGLQCVQLVHSEAELVEVDVDIHQQVRGQRGGEHPLWEAAGCGPAGVPPRPGVSRLPQVPRPRAGVASLWGHRTESRSSISQSCPGFPPTAGWALLCPPRGAGWASTGNPAPGAGACKGH
jgi:hypothetical protein